MLGRAKEAAAAAKEKASSTAATAAAAASVKASTAAVKASAAATTAAATAAVVAGGAAASAKEVATMVAASAASRASAVATKVSNRLTEEFDPPPADMLGPRLVSTNEARRWLELASAAYNRDCGPWTELATDQAQNLRLVGMMRDGVAEIGFRGSVKEGAEGERNLANWTSVNVRATPEQLDVAIGSSLPPTGVLVHRGFQKAYMALRDKLLAWLSEQQHLSGPNQTHVAPPHAETLSLITPRPSLSSRPNPLSHPLCAAVTCTGHSLGGAIATLCALDLAISRNVDVSLVTWGGPRVGNAAFVDLLCAANLAIPPLRIPPYSACNSTLMSFT
jgi:hypothetical protein